MAELIKVNAPVRKPLFEGVQGENEARSIQFDIEPWVTELGDGAVTATAKRSQDSQPYPVTVTRDGTTVTWKPTSTDTAFAGVGSFQLEYTVDSVLAKTCIWSTMVAPSLDPAGDPPDPYDNWLAEMRQIAADALQSEQNADTSAKTSEAWAVGQRGGVDVPSTDPAYENNAKYWAEQSLANQYGAFIVKSASGDIASFSDGADDVPMKSVKVAIVPKQAGSGDPSPSNVRPITGWTDADVTVAGKNLFNGASSTKEPCFMPAGRYGVFCDQIANFRYYDANQQGIDYWGVNVPVDGGYMREFTITQDAYYVNFSVTGDTPATKMQVERGGFTSYEPYNGHTTPVPLGQTVYGGTVDVVSGELVIDKASVDLGTLTWSYTASTQIFYADVSGMEYPATATDRNKGILSSIFKPSPSISLDTNMPDNSMLRYSHNIYIRNTSQTTTAGFKTFVNGQTLVYPLATPTTVQLTPAQVATLLGTNNVWADCGAVEVEYRADPTLAYAELQALILENL